MSACHDPRVVRLPRPERRTASTSELRHSRMPLCLDVRRKVPVAVQISVLRSPDVGQQVLKKTTCAVSDHSSTTSATKLERTHLWDVEPVDRLTILCSQTPVQHGLLNSLPTRVEDTRCEVVHENKVSLDVLHTKEHL